METCLLDNGETMIPEKYKRHISGQPIVWDTDNEGRIGLVHNDVIITDPFVSSCGRFEVDPVATYDVDEETAKAIVSQNGCLRIED